MKHALRYVTQDVEKRGNRIEKGFVVDPVEAGTVRLCRSGDGTSGPLGVKALTNGLNERGHGPWLRSCYDVATVHKMLTNMVYIGERVFNRCSARTQIEGSKAEQIAIAVPAIIERSAFEAVATTLTARTRG